MLVTSDSAPATPRQVALTWLYSTVHVAANNFDGLCMAQGVTTPDAFVDNFLGVPGLNTWPCTPSCSQGDLLQVVVRCWYARVMCMWAHLTRSHGSLHALDAGPQD